MATISDILTRIKNGTSSARREVEDALAAAQANDDYNALLSLTSERALERADMIDGAIARGEAVGLLAGVPFVVKDNFLAFGAPTTAASKFLENFDAPIQATAVDKLEAEGAICIGKANLDAFAHGGSTENSAYGVTRNAHSADHVAGGSSGGSAVVTALDIVPFALGTDTGGSIRQPASFNGVYGAKPTYGMVSRYGVVAMASSTDVVGCFATTAADAELVIETMAGRDSHDMTTLPDYFSPEALDGPLRIGLIKESISEHVDPEVVETTKSFADKLRAAGNTVEEVSMPVAAYAVPMYYVIVPAEISSNLARYDGVRYGRRAAATTLAELYGKSREEGFVAENKRRIMIGSYVLSSGYFDAYYQKAQKARTLLIENYNTLFESYDILLSPTSPTPAFAIGEKANDPIKMYVADEMTVPASLAGLPAIAIPAGQSTAGLPIGVQITGPMKSDARLFALAKSLEEVK